MYSMVKTSSGWKMVSKIKAVNGTPSCIGVAIGPKLSDIVPLEVGSEVVLEDDRVKTFVNKGLCSRGFSSHYYKDSHTSELASGDTGVVLVLKHTPKMHGKSRGRGGAKLSRKV